MTIEPRIRICSNLDKKVRSNIVVGVNMIEMDLIGKAARQAGMQNCKWMRETILKIATGEYKLVKADEKK